MTFISNLCGNPSFEVSLAGYTAIDATVLSQTSENAVAGQFSMQVQTPGLLTGEGFLGPSALFAALTTGALSVSLSGESGEVQVCAVVNPGGTVLATQTVQLTPAFQRVELNGLVIPGGDTLYLLVQTPSAQDLVFLVDAVQYEPESPVSMYIDGDSYGCNWLGTPGLSASVMPAQNPIVLIGGAHGDGFMNIIVPGSVSSFSASSGAIGGGSIELTVGYPQAAFDDFAIFEATDPDPAQTYVSWNNANELSGETAYNRNWMSVYPPLDYPVSDGMLWNRAAFMAVGFKFESVPENVAQNVTEVQAETFPLGGNADQITGPSNWDYPRALHTIIKPTRLNYAANPGFEADLSSWSAQGSGTITRTSAVSYGIAGYYDGVAIPQGDWSMLLTTTDATGVALLDVPFLFYGGTYIFSAYVLPGTAPGVTLGLPDDYGTILSQGVDTTDPEWLRPWFIFETNASEISISVTPTTPGTVWIDDVLIEEGEVLGTYFDGSFNDPDYMWETGGVPGSTRSYWYEGFLVGQSVVSDILAEQLPLGISAAPPIYGQPPSQ